MELHTIDVHHGGLPGAITSYLLLGDEPALVDPGPTASLGGLKKGLAAHGLRVRDLRRIFLTHVHLDHAGATGHLVGENAKLEVVVHEDGAPHMAEPDKLVSSTRRTFGEAHDRLWGHVRPVPAGSLKPWSPGGRAVGGLRPLATPGHISHHLAFLDESEGTLFSGDALGIVLAPGAPGHPPTPPPSLDVRAWEDTLEMLAQLGAERAAVTHAGIHEDDPGRRALRLLERLREVTRRARVALYEGTIEEDGEQFALEVRDQVATYRERAEVDQYFDSFSARTDWDGLIFYLERNPGA